MAVPRRGHDADPELTPVRGGGARPRPCGPRAWTCSTPPQPRPPLLCFTSPPCPAALEPPPGPGSPGVSVGHALPAHGPPKSRACPRDPTGRQPPSPSSRPSAFRFRFQQVPTAALGLSVRPHGLRGLGRSLDGRSETAAALAPRWLPTLAPGPAPGQLEAMFWAGRWPRGRCGRVSGREGG